MARPKSAAAVHELRQADLRQSDLVRRVIGVAGRDLIHCVAGWQLLLAKERCWIVETSVRPEEVLLADNLRQ